MNPKENWKLFAIAGVAVVFISFLVYRDFQREEQMRMLLSNQGMMGGKDGRPGRDPYIQNEVKNRIIKGYADLQICYKDHLKADPKVTDGDLKMDWQIDTDGEVISPEVIFSPFQNEKLHQCMKDQIKKWKFPEPPVKKYVTHTFKFEKKN